MSDLDLHFLPMSHKRQAFKWNLEFPIPCISPFANVLLCGNSSKGELVAFLIHVLACLIFRTNFSNTNTVYKEAALPNFGIILKVFHTNRYNQVPF